MCYIWILIWYSINWDKTNKSQNNNKWCHTVKTQFWKYKEMIWFLHLDTLWNIFLPLPYHSRYVTQDVGVVSFLLYWLSFTLSHFCYRTSGEIEIKGGGKDGKKRQITIQKKNWGSKLLQCIQWISNFKESIKAILI